MRFAIQKGINLLSILVAIIILADFLYTGEIFIEEVNHIKKEHQRYYNAAKNSHLSYRVNTDKHSFNVTEDFAKKIEIGEKINYTVSKIFAEINSYSKIESNKKEVYSLRLFSGLILPILVIIIMVLSFYSKIKISSLVLIFQILLIGNLIFLIS